MSPLALLRNADVFAPEPLGHNDLLIGGGSILAMAPSIPALPLPGCRVLDLQGARLIPGLIDAHVHLTGGGGEAGPSTRVPPVMFSALASAGITSCVGLLGTDGTTRNVAGLVAAALALREEGLSAWCWTGSYELPLLTLTGSVRSDIVFVDPILGVGEFAISDHRSSQPTFDEFLRIASDCHVAGMMSAKAGVLHLHLGDGPRGLELIRKAIDTTELPPRVFHPTHVNRNKRLFAEALQLAQRGCTIDVTSFPVEEGEDAYAAPEAIARYFNAGLPSNRLTVSSDGGGCLPTFDQDGRMVAMDVGKSSSVAETLAALLAQGLPLDRVLPVFTSNVASLLRLPRKGRIAVGADADLVVLDGDGGIRDVVARGRFLVEQGRPLVTGTFESAARNSAAMIRGR